MLKVKEFEFYKNYKRAEITLSNKAGQEIRFENVTVGIFTFDNDKKGFRLYYNNLDHSQTKIYLSDEFKKQIEQAGIDKYKREKKLYEVSYVNEYSEDCTRHFDDLDKAYKFVKKTVDKCTIISICPKIPHFDMGGLDNEKRSN